VTGVIDLSTERMARQDYIWVCGHCGCRNFELHMDGTAECSSCHHRSGEPGNWIENLVVADGEPADHGGNREIIALGSESLARARVIKRAQQDDAVVVMVILRDGTVSAWGDVVENETPERKSWLRHYFSVGLSLLFGEPPPKRESA
jgi:hypothetical protein